MSREKMQFLSTWSVCTLVRWIVTSVAHTDTAIRKSTLQDSPGRAGPPLLNVKFVSTKTIRTLKTSY